MSSLTNRCVVTCLAIAAATACDRSPTAASSNNTTATTPQTPAAAPPTTYASTFQPLLDRLTAIQPTIAERRKSKASLLEPDITLIERASERVRTDLSQTDRNRTSFQAASDGVDLLNAILKAMVKSEEVTERWHQKMTANEPTHNPRSDREVIEQGTVAGQNFRNAESDIQECLDLSRTITALVQKLDAKVTEAQKAFAAGH